MLKLKSEESWQVRGILSTIHRNNKLQVSLYLGAQLKVMIGSIASGKTTSLFFVVRLWNKSPILWLLLEGLSGFPGGSDAKESTCQCRRLQKPGFDPWRIGKIPWRREWQPTPVFLPGESPWTEEPGRGHKESDMAERLTDFQINKMSWIP